MAGDNGWHVPLTERIPRVWQSLLGKDTVTLVADIGARLLERSHTETITPAPHQVFRVLETPPDQVRVIIVGQDPYPTQGHANGLAFSVADGVWPLPPTLKNILRELADDTGHPSPPHGNLQRWQRQGVLLLNRHLTTEVGHPGAHQRLGWGDITSRMISTLAAQNPNRVAILWGLQARGLQPHLGDLPTVTSLHPSPLSATRGFFGSRPFTRTNRYLDTLGLEPIDWRLDEPPLNPPE